MEGTRKRFVISDMHFGHENIIQYANRPFSCAEECDATIINNWNTIVQPRDRVYVLGDVAMAKRHIEKIGLCNGKKILIMGNHDIFDLKYYTPFFEDIRSCKVLKTEKGNILLTHFPIHKMQNERWLHNIHGHTHDVNVDDKDSFYINACVEIIGYKPLLLNKLFTF